MAALFGPKPPKPLPVVNPADTAIRRSRGQGYALDQAAARPIYELLASQHG